MGSQEREGIGAHNMWGFTPAQDLLREARLQGEANILICQPGDIGHLLRTIGSRRGHPQHTINLYMWESQMEVVARHLLLLQVAQDWELPIRQKANVFLEIFGNCLVQGRTSRYIARLGKELENMLFETTAETDIVDLSLLKCRQKDQLGEVFKSWGYDVPCNITNLRDSRLRKFFGGRYDHRKNLVDWDYTNRLKEVASIIHHTQYRGWRLEGIAYEIGDQVYEQPNRTMISYAEGIMVKGQHRGLKKEMRGFWLDIRVGPFITFGVECDRPNAYAEELFSILNKGTGTEQHRHNTAEVAVYSVITYLWGLETRSQYTMTKKNDIYSGLGEDSDISGTSGSKESINSKSEREEQHRKGVETTTDTQHGDGGGTQGPNANDKNKSDGVSGGSTCHIAHMNDSGDAVRPPRTDNRTEATSRGQARARAQCIMETFDGVKVFMLSGDLNQHLSKPRFRGLFDRVHMSLTAVDFAGSDGINVALADDAVITMDTGRYMIPFNKEQQRTFIGNACSLARERGWEPLFGSERSSDGTRAPAKDAELSMDHLGFSFSRQPAYA